MGITASDIVTAIGHLPRNRAYNYINPSTRTKIQIHDIIRPEGPIYIRRYNPSRGEGPQDGNIESISSQMIWRVANAVRPNLPINIDRILGASYNTRSALETLLAHTQEFYYCYPGRIEIIRSSTEIKRGHKHLLYYPDEPHEAGVIVERETEIVISEMPSHEAIYESLTLPGAALDEGIDIEVQRRHAQIQIALIMIGRQLGYRIWIAQNDRGIVYNDQRLGEMDGIVVSLEDQRILASFQEAIRAALLIDCIWFRNVRFMPAVLEIEHTTGVRSGLVRMKNFQDALPLIQTRWVIVAPDEDRDKVLREANLPQFQPLNTKFMPYSAVEELYSLCQKRHISGVTEDFLESYMESCVEDSG